MNQIIILIVYFAFWCASDMHKLLSSRQKLEAKNMTFFLEIACFLYSQSTANSLYISTMPIAFYRTFYVMMS